MDKNMLRQEMKRKRRVLTEEYKKTASEIIFKKLSELPCYREASAVCVYMDSFGEVKTDLIINDLRKAGKEILFPVTDVKTNTLSLCRDCETFIKGAYGISEPEKKELVDFSYPDLIIVPGLAFDENKNRLGFGAGYYDRLLAKSHAFKIGICYDFQYLMSIPSEEHDILMDIILTN